MNTIFIRVYSSLLLSLLLVGLFFFWAFDASQRFNHFTPAFLAFLACGFLTIITGVVYLLIRPVQTRLHRMEAAVTKMRKGDLSARVVIDSQDALGQLGATFNDLAEHIQRLIDSQREMTRAVSHELRTPVARIRFGLEMVEDEPDADKRSDYLKGIDSDIEELNKLIDEILTYATLEEGKPSLNFKFIDIDAILQQVRKETQALGTAIIIEHMESQEKNERRLAECEERYIHRIVQNLVTNAIKYAKTRVRISSACEGGMYRIDVEDDGPGIPKDKWEKVFQPFARLDDSRTRSSGGYGLGLSIVKRIAYWHGGVASVYRSQLGGAKFTVIWPRKQALRRTLMEEQGEKLEIN